MSQQFADEAHGTGIRHLLGVKHRFLHRTAARLLRGKTLTGKDVYRVGVGNLQVQGLVGTHRVVHEYLYQVVPVALAYLVFLAVNVCVETFHSFGQLDAPNLRIAGTEESQGLWCSG